MTLEMISTKTVTCQENIPASSWIQKVETLSRCGSICLLCPGLGWSGPLSLCPSLSLFPKAIQEPIIYYKYSPDNILAALKAIKSPYWDPHAAITTSATVSFTLRPSQVIGSLQVLTTSTQLAPWIVSSFYKLDLDSLDAVPTLAVVGRLWKNKYSTYLYIPHHKLKSLLALTSPAKQ